ncbi:MAG: phosphoglycerate dehydrogenase [Gammaproteobacteria bacterium]
MYKVFIADKLADEGVEALKKYPEIDIDFSPGLSVEEAIPHAAEADAIIVRSETKIRGELLDAAQKLRVVGRAGIGVDNIDLDTTTERGIVVLNTPDANATTTAELAIGHMFSLSRNLPMADASVRSGKWERSKFVGAELSGKTVGIIGFGTIGRIFADRCLGLKMKVLGFDPFVTPTTFAEAGVEAVDLESLLARCDYVSLHCPVTDDTRGLLNRERMSAMKDGARIINCARGGLIDESALVELIKDGKLAGAALDVFDNEPPKDSRLLDVRNILFTPHLGASTHEAQTAVGVEIADQIAAYLIRGEVNNAVNTASVAPEVLQQLEPHMRLAKNLGKLLSLMVEEPLTELSIGYYGHAAKIDKGPVSNEALVGLLQSHLSVPVNQVNAAHLARRQGIQLTEMSSEESRDYLSSIRVTGNGDDYSLCLEGTLFDERHPRLVRVNDYEIEAVLEGHVILTRHDDRPGVIGAIGDVLGRKGINIRRMQVGIANDKEQAIAVIGVKDSLDAATLDELREIPAINRILQTRF